MSMHMICMYDMYEVVLFAMILVYEQVFAMREEKTYRRKTLSLVQVQ